VLLEAAVAHVLVDEHPVVVLVAVADEPDEVPVAQLAKEEDLGEPLPVALRAAVRVEVLDGHLLRRQPGAEPVLDAAPVDGAEPAAAEVVGAGEPRGDAPQLGAGEGVQVGAREREREVLRRERPRRAEARQRQPRRRRGGGGEQQLLALPPARGPPPRRRRPVVLAWRATAAAHAAEQRPPRLRGHRVRQRYPGDRELTGGECAFLLCLRTEVVAGLEFGARKKRSAAGETERELRLRKHARAVGVYIAAAAGPQGEQAAGAGAGRPTVRRPNGTALALP
jgi:hypothetical protein